MAMIDTSLDLSSRDALGERNFLVADWFGESLSALAPALLPSPLATAWSGAMAAALRLKRKLADRPAPPRVLSKDATLSFPSLAAQARLRLWADPALISEDLQIGKVHNLYIASNALDRVIVHAGETFSFWTQIGRPTKKRGYVEGRIFRQGRMERKAGVGLSQMSSALYEAALLADCEILERHARTMPAPGSQIAADLDTMVAWNYADIRFRAKRDFMLRVTFERGSLMVRLMSA